MDWTPSYEYRAEILNVIDGDTVELSIDVGLDVRRVVKCRLVGIQAPERRGSTSAAGEAARLHLRELIERHSIAASPRPTLVARTHKDATEKYGRYLVELLGAARGVRVCLNDRMVADGHAVVWDGQGARPAAA